MKDFDEQIRIHQELVAEQKNLANELEIMRIWKDIHAYGYVIKASDKPC